MLQGLTGPIGPPGPGGPNGEKVSIISFFFNLLTIGTEMFFVGGLFNILCLNPCFVLAFHLWNLLIMSLTV